MVLAVQLQRHRRRPCRAGEVEGGSAAFVEADVRGTDVGPGIAAKGDDPRRRALAHRRDDRVVGVEHGDAVDGQRLHELALRRGDGINTPEYTDMRQTNIEHGSHLRSGDGGEMRDVPQAPRAVLQDEVASVRTTLQHAQRQAYLAVVGRRRGHGRGQLREHRAEKVLGARLATRARDADDAHFRKPAEHDRREPAQRRQRVVNDDVRHVDRLRDHDASRAGLDGLPRKGVSVDVIPGQRDEQGAGLG